MRVDDFLSSVGVIKRRTVAKKMADNGLVLINGAKAKPSREIHAQDRIAIKGKHQMEILVLEVPTGNVAKARRAEYFSILSSSTPDIEF